MNRVCRVSKICNAFYFKIIHKILAFDLFNQYLLNYMYNQRLRSFYSNADAYKYFYSHLVNYFRLFKTFIKIAYNFINNSVCLTIIYCHLMYNTFLIILFPFLFRSKAHYVGTYDSKSGFTVSFSHIEDSGYFDCRLQDDPETYITFQIMINEQREFN